jgi:AraC-like DNA-binding protein
MEFLSLGNHPMRIVRSDDKWQVLLASRRESLCLRQLALRHGYRVAEMCFELECSRRYLHEVCVRDLGVAPKDWLQRERMTLAVELLRNGQSTYEVAQTLGFATAMSFRRAFQGFDVENPA